MEFLSHPVIAIVLLLGALIFFHELGHFLVGKAFGIGVEIFSIGFGPVIFSFQRKETNYRLSVIPLGGYVKFYGAIRSEEVPAHLHGKEFYRAPLIGRIMTVAAGPIANFILAIVVFAALGMYGLKQPPAIIGQTMPDSPAYSAGLQFQDQVIEVNGRMIQTWRDLQRVIQKSPGRELAMVVQRGEQIENVRIVPDRFENRDLAVEEGRIGITPLHVSSVITISDLSGPLAQAGLKTGMRVEAIRYNGEHHELRFWEELRNHFASMRQAGVHEFELQAFPVDPETTEKLAGSSSESYVVRIDQIQQGSMEEQLGILDGQLTVGRLTEALAGVEPGDRLLSWNGKPLQDAMALGSITAESREPTAELEVLRNGEKLSLIVDLHPVDVQRAEGRVTLYTIPVRFWGPLEEPPYIMEKYSNPFVALSYGFSETLYVTKTISNAVVGLFTGNIPLGALGGPIAIAKVASDSVRMGWQTFLIAMAWLSINLGLLNLLPIPVLDGGQLVLLFTEGVRRRPLSEVVVENYQKIGFVMVLALVIMATYNDIGRFWASMLRGMSSMF